MKKEDEFKKINKRIKRLYPPTTAWRCIRCNEMFIEIPKYFESKDLLKNPYCEECGKLISEKFEVK